jgi:hypothetical protein
MASHNVFLLHHSFFANTDVGHEKSSFLDDLLATLQTYQMEFDAQCVSIGFFFWHVGFVIIEMLSLLFQKEFAMQHCFLESCFCFGIFDLLVLWFIRFSCIWCSWIPFLFFSLFCYVGWLIAFFFVVHHMLSNLVLFDS